MIKRLHTFLDVGDWQDAKRWSERYPDGTIVNVATDAPSLNDDVIHIKLVDGPGNEKEFVRKAIEAIVSRLDQSQNVFVHCVAGHSRSPAIACGAYALFMKTNLSVPLEKIMKQDVKVRPKDALLIHVLEVLAEHRGLQPRHAHDPAGEIF
jgi:hypothetical protein